MGPDHTLVLPLSIYLFSRSKLYLQRFLPNLLHTPKVCYCVFQVLLSEVCARCIHILLNYYLFLYVQDKKTEQ